VCEERFYEECYRLGEFFLILSAQEGEAASLKLPTKLKANIQGEALNEAKKHGHGIVVMKIGEV
jgi:hypothetical protein